MKKTLILAASLLGAISAYPQGAVTFSDGNSDETIHIFAPQGQLAGAPEVTGNQGLASGAATGGVASDVYYNNNTDGNYAGTSVAQTTTNGATTTGGVTAYTGGAIGNTLTSNPTAAGAYNYNNGSDYTVQMYAAPGLNDAFSALQPVTQYVTTIATSSKNGGQFKTVSFVTDPGIPNTSGGTATIALVAWYNGGGATSYAAALAAGVPTGVSPLDNLAALGNTGSPANPVGDMIGLESFSLTYPAVVVTPEPSTIALGVIGASTLLFRRRNKK